LVTTAGAAALDAMFALPDVFAPVEVLPVLAFAAVPVGVEPAAAPPVAEFSVPADAPAPAAGAFADVSAELLPVLPD
jgi:hypothetical protein